MNTDFRNRTDPKSLLLRWDAQQTGYIEFRAECFDAMARIVNRVGGDHPRILDLACGPGSLSAAMLERNPKADIVAVDKDPVLLAIATDVFAHDDRVAVVEADLDDAAWTKAALAGGQNPNRPFDAVVSATALHWLRPPILARVYFELADMVREDGVFMNADHLYYDAVAQPRLRALSEQDEQDQQDRSFGKVAEDWDTWWAAAQARPEYAEAARRRAEIWEGKMSAVPKVTQGYHLETLRSAGFRETDIVWRYLNGMVVCGFR